VSRPPLSETSGHHHTEKGRLCDDRAPLVQSPRRRWRNEALDGHQLVTTDALSSAGGGTNGDAAVLGTPACSVYAGNLAAVDRALVAAGRLTLLQDCEGMARMQLVQKAASPPPEVADHLVVQSVDRLLALARP